MISSSELGFELCSLGFDTAREFFTEHPAHLERPPVGGNILLAFGGVFLGGAGGNTGENPVVIGQPMVAPCFLASLSLIWLMVISLPLGTLLIISSTSLGAGMTSVPVPHLWLI